MKKSFKRKLAAWVGILFVITQIIPARTINATTEEEENKKYGTIEHYNGILFGDDNLVSYDNKNYAYISKGGDNEGAVAVGGDMHVPYLDNSMDFGASAASGYTGIGSKYEDNGMPTVMTSGKWDKINGSNITVYGSRVLLAQEDNQGFTVTGSDVEYSTRQNIKNAISKFKSKVSNTIGYIEGIETNGIFEDNLYGKNIITNNEKNIVKVKLDSGIIPSLDLKGSVDLDKQYVIYSNAKDIKFSGGSVRYDGADVWGSSLPKDSPLFKIASNFIWVFPNAETVEINNYAVIGSVVAPKAKVHGNGSSVNGQLFASSLHQEGGFELHNFTSRWNWDLDSKGSIEIEKVDSKNSSIKLSGAVFEVYDSEEKLKGTITTDSQGKGSLGNLEYGEYTLVEKTAPVGYVLSSDRITVNVNSEGITYKTITNTKILGKINILKVDSADENIKLPGAVFEVKDSEGTVVDTITTDENGVGTSKELPYGSYTVAEVSAPSGYELSGESKNVTIDSNGETIELTFENTKILGKINILKVDGADEGVKLSGAVFEVKDSEGTVVDTITTDENGVGTSKELPYGSYTVAEVSAPSGYELSGEAKNVTIDSNGEIIELTFKNSKLLGSIAIEKVDSEDSEIKLKGAEFKVLNSDGEEVGNIVTGEDGKGSLGSLPYGEYTVIETKAPDGYELSLDLVVVEVNSKAVVYKTITNTKILGKINILKVDSADENIKLPGAVFEVKDFQGTVVDTITTDENGVGTSKELPYGSYTVAEVSAPSGYELSGESKNVTIDSNGQIIELTFKNSKLLGSIAIEKVDSEDSEIKLKGAEFKVLNSDGEEVGNIVTGEDGKGSLGSLPYGEYTVIETKAPDGYELSLDLVVVEVNSKAVVYKTITNTKILGKINILKVDSADEGVKLPGAVFEVKDFQGTVVDTITTDENGVGTSKELPYGSYTVAEVSAPSGYELSEESKNVTIDSNGQIIELTFKNSKLLGSISIEKVDSEDSELKLEGAEFKVINSDGEEVGNIVTGEDGKGSLGNLPYGEYTLMETKAPDGYELSLDLIVVEVNSKAVVYKTITNTKILGKISILKVDSIDEDVKLLGAVFEVKDSEGTVVDTITTGENGVGTSKELPYGNYTVTEVSAPPGYELSGESKDVTIDSNGQTIELTFKNSKLLGSISIEKVDSEDSELKLEGAEFKVINSDGEEVGNIVTGEDGKGSLGNLPYGEYTLMETKAPDGYELSLDLIVVEVNSKAVVYKTITNTKILGKISILKVDSTDADIKLPGAVFEIKDSEGTVVDTITTGENGVGTSKELPYGSYTVTEVSAPPGYELSGESKDVTINSNGQTIELTFENTKILGKINILKVDSADEDIKLIGAVFEIKDSEGTVVDTITTDENGVGTSKELPYGSYTVTEVTAPSGYELSEESKNVTIDSNGETIELTFENTKLLGSISIEKVDSKDSELKLEGAEFKVINSDGEEVGNIVTGEDGKGSLGNLPYGEYTLIETKAPDGYKLSIDLIVIEVNSETEIYKTITNTKILGKINILKVDSDDEDVKLSGAVFEVKDSQGTVVDTITTGENGVGTSKELPYGSYTVAEVSAPEGYELSEESKNVTIDSNGQTIGLTFENTKILGNISILKVDSIDEDVKLLGAEFEIRDLEGNILDTLITNEEGVANSIQLPYGSYIVIETKAPEGYVLNDFSENVTINNENLEILLKVENIKEELLPEDPKEPEVPSKEDNEKEPVKTGDESGNIGGLGLMSLLSLIAMLLMHKKK
ncbi:SpaA isopeptide-forming pilin-related protein [Clostridium paraputrificum]|uniref:SpaA isopeptide-forming pilin-related protein n=13 Tax=Clostridiaceae TaxID=31979 RepID=UPI003D350D1B